jgi:malate dehydrogenase (quinone)
MCSHSLLHAKSLGYGLNYSILPVGGNFYTSNNKLLNGKVYTMQSGKLPFAAVHGDPNLYDDSQTRFGPSATIMPFLERNSLKTFTEFVRSSWNSLAAFKAFINVIFEPLLFSFLLKSLIYEIPYFGAAAFAKEAKKIIPNVKARDFQGGKTKAGIRPQLIDVTAGRLVMGETEIKGDKILFNITPSPGATACLYNAKQSLERIKEFLPNNEFRLAEIEKDLL